jgi:hypothetical protein
MQFPMATVKKNALYRDYKKERVEFNLPFAHLLMDSRIFNEEYNLGFFSPKKDQCELCIAFQNAEGEGKGSITDEISKTSKKETVVATGKRS